jgi:hypothetical protein
MCAHCSQRWFVTHAPLCPTCRTVLVGMPHVDPVRDGPKRRRRICITFPEPDSKVGVTVRNHPPGGVRVVALETIDDAMAIRCGVRMGDVITHLNGIPVNEHSIAAQAFDRAAQTRTDVVCAIRRVPWWML